MSLLCIYNVLDIKFVFYIFYLYRLYFINCSYLIDFRYVLGIVYVFYKIVLSNFYEYFVECGIFILEFVLFVTCCFVFIRIRIGKLDIKLLDMVFFRKEVMVKEVDLKYFVIFNAICIMKYFV